MIQPTTHGNEPLLSLAAAAQPSRSPQAVAELILWIGVIILVLVALGIIAIYFRNRVHRADPSESQTGSLLESLRAMHRRGELSQEEYESARASLMAGMTGSQTATGSHTRKADRPAAGGESGDREGPRERIARPGFDLTGEPLPPRRDTPPDAGHPDGGEPSG